MASHQFSFQFPHNFSPSKKVMKITWCQVRVGLREKINISDSRRSDRKCVLQIFQFLNMSYSQRHDRGLTCSLVHELTWSLRNAIFLNFWRSCYFHCKNLKQREIRAQAFVLCQEREENIGREEAAGWREKKNERKRNSGWEQMLTKVDTLARSVNLIVCVSVLVCVC